MENTMSFFWVEVILYLIFAIPCSIFDIILKRVPRILTVAAFIPYSLFLFVFSINPDTFSSPLIALGSTLALYLFARLFTGRRLGVADIIFGTYSGFFCGFPECFFAVFAAAIIGLLFYIFSYLFKKKDSEYVTRTAFGTFSIPFVPFIAAGALLVKILGFLYY